MSDEVKAATDAQIQALIAMCDADRWPLGGTAWFSQRAQSLIARIRAEQARAEKAEAEVERLRAVGISILRTLGDQCCCLAPGHECQFCYDTKRFRAALEPEGNRRSKPQSMRGNPCV